MPSKLKELRAEIDTQLVAYFDRLPASLGIAISSTGEQALEVLREFALRPGKRLRGALAVAAYEMFGGKNHQAALKLAVAIELAQDYLLIIDDVMDRSDTRRGSQTVHMQYRELLKDTRENSNRAHVGDMMGLSVGLFAQHLSSRLLSEIDDEPERLVRVQQLYQTNIAATAFGQMDDLMNQVSERFSLADTTRMYVLKSSYYTFVNPLQLGAVLAGANKEVLEQIREFGEHAGLAFQLQDDLLGMFGDEAKIGKSTMDDMHEGKMTLLIRHALNSADSAQLACLRANYGNARATRKQHEEVCAILTNVGSRDHVAREARAEAQQALMILDAQVSWDDAWRKCLSDLVEYVVLREA